MYEATSDVISCIIYGHDVGKESEEFQKLFYRMSYERYGSLLVGLMMFAPFLGNLPFFQACTSVIWSFELAYTQKWDRRSKHIKNHVTHEILLTAFYTKWSKPGRLGQHSTGIIVPTTSSNK